METREYLVLSTAHVSEATAKWLNEQGEISAAYHRTRQAPTLDVSSNIWGWLISADTTSLDGQAQGPIPDDVLRVLAHTIKAGHHRVMLDCDAEKADELPTYEW